MLSKSGVTKVEAVLLTLVVLLAAIVGVVYFTLSRPAESATIKIGVPLGITGSMAQQSSEMWEAAKIAAEEINAKGGVLGKNVELVLGDEGGTLESGTAVIERLISQDKVVAMAGWIWSTITLAAIEITHKYGIPCVIASAVSSSISDVRANKSYTEIFRVAVASSLYGNKEAAVITDVLKAKTYALVVEEGNEYVMAEARAIASWISQNRPTVQQVAFLTVQAGTKDFYPTMTQIKGLGADVTFGSPAGASMPLMVKAAHELNVSTMVFGTFGFSFSDWTAISGLDAAEYYISTIPSWPQAYLNTNPVASRFITKWRALFKTDPSVQVTREYDAVYVLCDAIKRAGSTDSKSIATALAATNFQGLKGNITFNPKTGDWDQEPQITQQIQNGTFRVIAPPEWAEKPVAWPSWFIPRT